MASARSRQLRRVVGLTHITADPAEGAYRTDLAHAARQPLVGDAFGNSFVKQNMEDTAGGE